MLEECSLPLDRDIDTMSVLSHGDSLFFERFLIQLEL